MFEDWLRQVWREKDELMDGFLRDGDFGGGSGDAGVAGVSGSASKEKEGGAIVIPVELRSKWEIIPYLSYFLPIILAWIAVRLLP